MKPVSNKLQSIERFFFRDIHEKVFLGTASDRYAGWLGQIYSPELYKGKITRRTKRVGDTKLVEEILPIESVREYFRHFSVLELDFTFYGLLLDDSGKPTRIFYTLQEYKNNIENDAQLIIKVPQVIFARKLMRNKEFAENKEYLSTDSFIRKFYEPATEILANSLKGFIFEQEYQRKSDRVATEELAGELDRFFDDIPEDNRYHVEFRTAEYLAAPLFRVLKKYGVGQVLSHWTWLPGLRVQLKAAGNRFYNSGNNCVVRLMTPRGVRYEEAYIRAHPFNKLVENMINPEMIDDTVDVMKKALSSGLDVNVIINNRAGGNAPMIAQIIAKKFITSR